MNKVMKEIKMEENIMNNKKTHSPLWGGIVLIIIQIRAVSGSDNYTPSNIAEGFGYYIWGIFGILIIIENMIRAIKK